MVSQIADWVWGEEGEVRQDQDRTYYAVTFLAVGNFWTKFQDSNANSSQSSEAIEL